MRCAATLLVLVGVLLAAAGCDDDGSSTASTPVESTSSTVVGDPIEGASLDRVTVPATGSETALLTEVRAASHEGYDRVVFVFRNGRPGALVQYVERPVTADGSGAEVAIDGSAVLVVRMEPALDADLTQESAPPTYTGPARFSPDTPQVAETRSDRRLRGRADLGRRGRRTRRLPCPHARRPAEARARHPQRVSVSVDARARA